MEASFEKRQAALIKIISFLLEETAYREKDGKFNALMEQISQTAIEAEAYSSGEMPDGKMLEKILSSVCKRIDAFEKRRDARRLRSRGIAPPAGK